jgi:hypothetical protein
VTKVVVRLSVWGLVVSGLDFRALSTIRVWIVGCWRSIQTGVLPLLPASVRAIDPTSSSGDLPVGDRHFRRTLIVFGVVMHPGCHDNILPYIRTLIGWCSLPRWACLGLSGSFWAVDGRLCLHGRMGRVIPNVRRRGKTLIINQRLNGAHAYPLSGRSIAGTRTTAGRLSQRCGRRMSPVASSRRYHRPLTAAASIRWSEQMVSTVRPSPANQSAVDECLRLPTL